MRKLHLKYFLSFLLWGAVNYISTAQKTKDLLCAHAIDSLKKVLEKLPDDTNKVNTLSNLCGECKSVDDYNGSIFYAKSAVALAEKIGFDTYLASAYNNIGNIYFEEANFPIALDYYYKALTKGKEMENKKDIAAALGNLGNIYFKQGNYPQALEYYFKALKLAQEIGNKKSIAAHLGNIGIVYEEQGNYPLGLEYDFKALALASEIDNKYLISGSMENIGVIYGKQGNYEKGLEYLFKSYATGGLTSEDQYDLIDIGDIYGYQGNYPKALEYYSKALRTSQLRGDKDAIANLYSNVGGVYTKLKNYSRAKSFLDSALVISKNVGDKKYIRNTYRALAVLDSATGNYKTSYEDYEKYIMYRDSLINQESVKKITQMEIGFRYEKREDSIRLEQDKANIFKTAEIKRKSIITYSAIIISILTLLLAIVLINRQQVLRKKDKMLFEKNLALYEQEKKRVEGELAGATLLLDEYIKSMVEKNALLEQFKIELENIKVLKAKEIDENRIEHLEELNKTTILTEDDWNKFRELFEQVHKGFLIRLKEKFHDLSQAEVRLICLTKLNLDTKQMAGILGVSSNSIIVTRHRLRKKLGLSDTEEINSIANSV